MNQSKKINTIQLIIIKLIRYTERSLRKRGAKNRFEQFKDLNYLKESEKSRDALNGFNIMTPKKLKLPENIYKDINNSKESSENIIGEIDQDGYILSRVGEIPGLPLISKENYMNRERFKIYLVIYNGVLGIKKMYLGNKYSFVNEYEILNELEMFNLNVPKILNADFDNLTITISYVKGPVLREELAKKGAIIRDSQVGKASDYTFLQRRKITEYRINQGKSYLNQVVSSEFYNELKLLVNEIHSKGILINDIKYGNVIIGSDSQKPYLIDFESSWKFSNTSSLKFRLLVKYENYILEKHFN